MHITHHNEEQVADIFMDSATTILTRTMQSGCELIVMTINGTQDVLMMLDSSNNATVIYSDNVFDGIGGSIHDQARVSLHSAANDNNAKLIA